MPVAIDNACSAKTAGAPVLPLFASLENPPPATVAKAGKPVHKPITDFTFCAERSVAASVSVTLDQWRTDIGETAPLAIAKESRASYAGERPAKHAKHTKKGSRSPFASFRVFRGHPSPSASIPVPPLLPKKPRRSIR
jgi:hypothetical protein